MLSSGEAVELRELHRRAYAPGGSLSAADAARLHNLEDKRVAEVVPARDAERARVVSGGRLAADPAGSALVGGTTPVGGSGQAVGPDAGAPVLDAEGHAGAAVPVARAKKRTPWVSLAAGAAALLVGLGVGWVLAESRHAPASVVVTAEQQARGEQIAPDGTDPGSVLVLGEREGIIAWYLTKDEGKSTCLVLDGGGEEIETSCSRTESLSAYPVSTAVDILSDDDYIDVTFANLAFGPDGAPAVSLSGYRTIETNAERYVSDEERTIAADLNDAGYRADSIYVVGYHAEEPIWTAISAAGEYCLIRVSSDAEPLADCGPFGDLREDPLTIAFVESGEDAIYSVVAQLSSAPDRPEFLTITETAIGTTDVDVETGEVVDEASGDAG
jgi:hypothetical protein